MLYTVIADWQDTKSFRQVEADSHEEAWRTWLEGARDLLGLRQVDCEELAEHAEDERYVPQPIDECVNSWLGIHYLDDGNIILVIVQTETR